MDRLAFSTNAYTNGRWKIEDAIRRIAKEGYSGVTLLADQPLIWVPSLTFAQFCSIRDVLQETGIKVASVNGFTATGYYGQRNRAPGQDFGPSFADLDQASREWKVWYTKKVLDFAEAIGTTDVSIGSGYPPSQVDKEIIWIPMRDAIAECVYYASRKGVRLNIEYEPFLMIGSQEDAARILAEIPSPYFGLHLDIGHSFCCGENVVDQIFRFRNRIHGTDVEDIGLGPDGKPVHAHLVPGDGVMPLRKIFETFKEVGYQGWYVVELYNHFRHPVKVTKASIRYLSKLLKEVYG